MWFELHVPQPSTVAQEEHINHPSTLTAINHRVDAFVCGCNTYRCTHIMHLRLHLIFLCLEWPWSLRVWLMPALLKDMCRQKTWRPDISRTTRTPPWIKGYGSINEMVVSQSHFDKANMLSHQKASRSWNCWDGKVERRRKKQWQREKNTTNRLC